MDLVCPSITTRLIDLVIERPWLALAVIDAGGLCGHYHDYKLPEDEQ